MGNRHGRARASRAASQLGAPALVALCSLWVAGPAASAPTAQGVTGHCEIRFFATSTLHDFNGEANARSFQLAPRIDASNELAGWSGSVEIAVAEMETGIERRNRNMRAMFDADRFPLIVADFPHVERAVLTAARSGAEPGVDFNLTIRETTHPVAAKVTHWTEEGGHASFDAEFEVSLESFGLEVPAVLGLLRVGDIVTVRAHVMLDGLPAEPRKTAAFGRPRPVGSLASSS